MQMKRHAPNPWFALIPMLLGMVFALSSCERTPDPQVAFYYWRSGLRLGKSERAILADNKASTIYLRYFDVKVNETGHIIPEAPVHGQANLSDMSVIPVIYIKNDVFSQIKNDSSLNMFAKDAMSLTRQINTYYKVKPREIQFDCDWTPSTRDRFFAFLKACKRLYPITLSATIRLHQVKFARQTGVPPVDKGMLMYYNMGEIAPDSLNSIYDRDIAMRYVRSLKYYVLPLDVALPIYSWGVRVRDNRVTQLLSKFTEGDLRGDKHFAKIAPNRFRVVAPGFLHGQYFRQGDEIKIEYATAKQLRQIAHDISANIRHAPSRVAFFDLDTLNTNRYDKKEFKKVAHSLN